MSRAARLAACFGLAAALLGACAPPATVFLNPRYAPAKYKRVGLLDFDDAPSMAGSGRLVAGIFEKYLFLNNFAVVDQAQISAAMQELNLPANQDLDLDSLRSLAAKVGVDAFVLGQVTDFTDAQAQTVMETMTLDQTNPVYSQVVTTQRNPDGSITRTRQDIQTGIDTTSVDQPVAQTEVVDAHVGLSVRMVDAQSGEVLWSAADSDSGPHLNDAAEEVSVQITRALQQRLKAAGD